MNKHVSFGICHVSVAPVRASASDTSEMVTQLLFGDYVRVTENGNPWVRITIERDGYEGWMDVKQLAPISVKEFKEDSGKAHQLVHNKLLQLRGSMGDQFIMLGSALPNYSDHQCSFGDLEFEIADVLQHQRLSVTETAEEYLNAPYLWGGKSLLGVDCSGFVQNVTRLHGFAVPRDASEQAKLGKEISFNEREPGDLAFFINDSGKIHHVGIIISKDKIIHASGFVRRNQLDGRGILDDKNKDYTHKLRSIRRLSAK